MTHTSTELLSQECADYATSLRSAVMVVKLEGRTPPVSFLRAAELFERAATELNIKHARVKELEAALAQQERKPLSDSECDLLIAALCPDFTDECYPTDRPILRKLARDALSNGITQGKS